MTFTRSLLVGATALALMTGGAQAADLLVHSDPIYDSPMFNFEGFYVGGSIGVTNRHVDAEPAGAPVLDDAPPELHSSVGVGTIGVVAGANFALNEAMLAGVEFQGDLLWGDDDTDQDVAVQMLLLGRLGFYLTDATLLYGTAGGGFSDGDGVYALGAGVEQALTDNISVRGEAMALGGGDDSGMRGKLAASLLWHVN